jgi:hypothetical protein
MRLKPIATLVSLAAMAVTVSACGSGEHAKFADNLGPGYVQVGQLNYQVQLSRELNTFSSEDHAYLAGLTKSQLAIPYRSDEWFGVFMQVFNWSDAAQTPTNDFYITDVTGHVYRPMVNPAPNVFTYQPLTIPKGGQLPATDSNAYFGPTQGELLLFQIPYTTLDNRPLVLHIVNPADPLKQSRIELDV